MHVVIDIPEELFNIAKDGMLNEIQSMFICGSVSQGIPLPKGHGKIVDISKIDHDRIESDNPIIYLTINGEYIEAVSLDYLNSLPTIIEADKEREGEK